MTKASKTKKPSATKKQSTVTTLVKRENALENYDGVLSSVVELLESARRASARAVNALMTATYWEIGRRIVEYEQRGQERAEYYGEQIIELLAQDLSARFGRGFRRSNLFQMRAFYLTYSEIVQTVSALSPQKIVQTLSGQSQKQIHATASRKSLSQIRQTLSGKFNLAEIAAKFPLPWSHYVLLMQRSRSVEAREFYEAEAVPCRRKNW